MNRSAALLLTLVTGATGLVYEVAWQRYLATLLGSHAEATAAVLGLFLAGLSGGYALFGAVSRRAASVLRVYGLVEAGIGVWALVFPLSFAAVQALSLALPAGGGSLSFAIDVGLAALLVLPPTLLMGGTIPLLTQGLSRDLADATRFHAWVYASNTAGACVGALAAGFVLLPAFGLTATMLAMGAVNVAVGACFVAFGARGAAAAPVAGAGAARPPALTSLVAIALLAGFAMMATQTVLNRIAGLAFGSSPYTFSLVVALFVSCIALGSAVVARLPRIPERVLAWNLALLLGWFVALHALLDLAPFLGHVLRLPLGRGTLSFYAYQVGAFAVLLLAVGPGVVLSGATLPLLFHHLKREHGDLGRVAGSLYAWNTVGSLLGALVGGHLLLVWLDLDGVLRAALSALAVALAIALALGGGRRLAGAALAGSLLLVLALPGWDARALSSGFFRAHTRLDAPRYTPGAVLAWHYQDRALLSYDDDPVASVAVHEFYSDGVKQRALLSNGKPDGSTRGDYATQALLGLLPALLLDRLERVFVVGYGTGVTAGELAALDGTREIVVAEISSAVVAADPFFASANLRAAASPKLRLLRSDAYRALLRSETRFDAIISEPSNPWMAGIEMLYSREFLAAARSRLAPGGAYVQWFHTYESDNATLALVLRTFAAVFPDTTVWYTLGGDLLLVGFAEPRPALSPAELAARMARPDLAAGLRRAGIENATALAAHELLPLGVLAAMDLDGPIHTLLHPRLTYRAARAFFAAGRSRLPPPTTAAARAAGAERSLVRQLAAAEGGALSDASYAVLTDEACRHVADVCVALLADWLRTRPASPALAARLARLRATPHGEPIPIADVRDYAALLAGRPRGASITPESARHASALARRYASVAVPFDGDALVSLWRRCEPSDACERGLAEALTLFGASAQ